MKKITNAIELKNAIHELEIKQVNEGIAIKEQLNVIKENLKPVNLIKNTFKETAGTSSLKDNMLTGVVGLVAGYLTKKVVFGSTINPIKKIAGTLLQIAVAGSAPKIKSAGTSLLKHFFNRSREEKHEENYSANKEIQGHSL
ncbi:MAG TPA: hypothetical protein VN026_18575 [Bacteroidia bacterium]|jgi:hypothetical protein|nr:hypothetical protein [Bacteroidia bacterium]